jgi:hypothetical protein
VRARATGPASLGCVPELSTEDQKLATLARAAMARTGAAEGAAVRDLDGRTYAAAAVTLDSLTLTALEVCVAMALSSGARGLEAAVRLGGRGTPDLRAVHELGGEDVVLHLGDVRGRIET